MAESTTQLGIDTTDRGGTAAPRTFFAVLAPENNSGVLGLGRVTLDGTTLAVDVVADGLTPGEAHPFHIHGFPDGRIERLSLVTDDADRDGFVETAEAEPVAYGPVLLPLTVPGGDAAEFPTADATGTISFSQRLELDPADPEDAALLGRLQGRVLQFHGLALPAAEDTEAGTDDGAGREHDGAGAGGDATGTMTAYDPLMPVAQAALLPLPKGVDVNLAMLAEADAATFLARAEAVLAALMPYALDPEGKGPAAPEPEARPGADTVLALLAPSNNSGAFGAAAVSIDEAAGTLTVRLVAEGLTPDAVHGAHIHGFASDVRSLLPNIALDADGDGFVEDQEGEEVVGPVILALTADGSISDAALTAPFPRADAEGSVVLEQRYAFDLADPAQAAIFEELTDRLAGREVQLHGLELPEGEGDGTEGEVDGQAGYIPQLPVANGILLPVGEDQVSRDLVAIAGTLFGNDLAFGV
jgi:Cu/Zn superoxide dismutase